MIPGLSWSLKTVYTSPIAQVLFHPGPRPLCPHPAPHSNPPVLDVSAQCFLRIALSDPQLSLNELFQYCSLENFYCLYIFFPSEHLSHSLPLCIILYFLLH